MRRWFEDAGFTDVEPAALAVSPGNEAHLHAFSTQALTTAGEARTLHLHTSPEFACKKLLAAGETAIFTLARVWRNRERGPLHSPEFTMLEWYRAVAPYETLMDDCATLLALAADAAGTERFSWRGRDCDPRAAPERVSVAQAFVAFAGIDLLATVEASGATDRDALTAGARSAGVRVADDDGWADVFSRVMVEKVEPRLGIGRPTVLYGYPVSEAALARSAPADPRTAERFELYACGVELANAFGELTDPAEQRRRFEAEMTEMRRVYGADYPIDEDLLSALAHMPPASGAALGFDRLVMLAVGAAHIDDVLWTPVPTAFAAPAPRRLRVETAPSATGGRALPLKPLQGRRPPPLALGPSSIGIGSLLFAPFGPEFTAPEMRLHTVADGHLIVGSGYDGAIVEAGGRLVRETAAFTPFAPQALTACPFDLPGPVHTVTVTDVVSGFDGAFRNYYHWLIHGLWRTWLTSQAVPGAAIALPDFDAEIHPGQVAPAVLEESFQAAFPAADLRVLGPGAHPVRILSFAWSRPTAPTDLVDLAGLAPFFEAIRDRLVGRTRWPSRRIYLSRSGATDSRLPPGAQPALEALLARHGFETVAAETLTFEEQVRVASQARVLLGAHGAALTNLVFSPRKALVIELQRRIGEEVFFRPWFYQLACARGQRYAGFDTGRPDWLSDLDAALTRLGPPGSRWRPLKV